MIISFIMRYRLALRSPRPECPGLGVVRCYRTLSNEIQNHWLICSPLSPHKQSSLRIGPELSRAKPHGPPCRIVVNRDSFRHLGFRVTSTATTLLDFFVAKKYFL